VAVILVASLCAEVDHMTQFISGTFYDAQTANKAVNDIVALDYPRERITIIMSSQTRYRFWGETGASGDVRNGDPIAVILAGAAGAKTANGGPAPRLVVAGPAAAALNSEGSAAGGSGVLRALARLGMPRTAGERVSVERIMRSNAARNVMESLMS
jgi:hypothetical protein